MLLISKLKLRLGNLSKTTHLASGRVLEPQAEVLLKSVERFRPTHPPKG
jgi:hypothetical protein